MAEHFEIPLKDACQFLNLTLKRSQNRLVFIHQQTKAHIQANTPIDAAVPEISMPQKYEYVVEAMASWTDKVSKNPKLHHDSLTMLQHIDNVQSIAAQNNDTIGVSTIRRLTNLFKLSLKKKQIIANINSPLHNAKRLAFATKFINYLNGAASKTSVLVFMDEMTFNPTMSLHKGLAGPHEKVYDTHLDLPTSHPQSLNISSFMTKDTLLHMGFRQKATDGKLFKSDLYDALKKAHVAIDSSKKIILVLDNAPYHTDSAINEMFELINQQLALDGEDKREFGILKIAPCSPDLNLVEYFNHYYKATLRRALNVFDHLVIERLPKKSGRPKKQKVGEDQEERYDASDLDPLPLNPHNPQQPPIYVRKLSIVNLQALAEYVYFRIKNAQSAIGNWVKSFSHIIKWCEALKEKDGDYVEASRLVATKYVNKLFRMEELGRVMNYSTQRMTSIRLMDENILSVISPKRIDFTVEECNPLAIERSTVNVHNLDQGALDKDDEEWLDLREVENDEDFHPPQSDEEAEAKPPVVPNARVIKKTVVLPEVNKSGKRKMGGDSDDQRGLIMVSQPLKIIPSKNAPIDPHARATNTHPKVNDSDAIDMDDTRDDEENMNFKVKKITKLVKNHNNSPHPTQPSSIKSLSIEPPGPTKRNIIQTSEQGNKRPCRRNNKA